jgi:N-acylglucosamine 2-epimerase
MTASHSPADLREIYRRELLDNVVPFWQTHGVDRKQGGFFTCLDRDGSLYSTEKYMWLQGRAVWTFARLHNELGPNDEWLALAEQGAAFLRRFGKTDDGRAYFSLTRDGRPTHIQRKIYSEVFYAMAMSEMARATGRDEYLAEAKEMFWRICDLWRHPEKLARPQLAGTQPASSLADPMVLLWMIEELGQLDPDPRYDDLAAEMVRLVHLHIRPDRQIVLEHVGLDGSTLDGPAGRLMNPGHAIELGWFLLHRARATGDAELAKLSCEIIDWSFAAGWDSEHGGLLYFLDVEGKPPLQLEWNMKLWWPATEAIYALLLAWDTSGERRFLDMHAKIHNWAWEHFRDGDTGEWFGYLDRAGRPTHMLKGGQWKGFFHLPRALLYSVKLLAAGL